MRAFHVRAPSSERVSTRRSSGEKKSPWTPEGSCSLATIFPVAASRIVAASRTMPTSRPSLEKVAPIVVPRPSACQSRSPERALHICTMPSPMPVVTTKRPSGLRCPSQTDPPSMDHRAGTPATGAPCRGPTIVTFHRPRTSTRDRCARCSNRPLCSSVCGLATSRWWLRSARPRRVQRRCCRPTTGSNHRCSRARSSVGCPRRRRASDVHPHRRRAPSHRALRSRSGFHPQARRRPHRRP